MKQIELKNLKLGELFRFTDSETAPIWVRDEYDRTDRKYECHKYDNTGHTIMSRGTRKIYLV